MKSLPERIMEHAEAMPEATPICPATLLHLGQKGRGGSGPLPPGPFRPAQADPPRGLHAPDRVPLRAVCAGHRKVTPSAFGRARPASPRRQRSIRDLRVCFLGESRTARPGAARGYSAVHRIDAGRGVQLGGTGTGADATEEPRVSDRTSGECRQPDSGRASKGAAKRCGTPWQHGCRTVGTVWTERPSPSRDRLSSARAADSPVDVPVESLEGLTERAGSYAPPGAALSEALLRQAARATARARSVSTSPSPSR